MATITLSEYMMERIVAYFESGYKYQEIVALLSGKDGIRISLRQLKRNLASLGLFRRKPNCSFNFICDAIQREINNSGSLLGYRRMHHKLQIVHKVQTKQNVVRQVQKLLDPEGVARRKAKRLTRRKYIAKGPNYLWHVDGYDKLKPYGFCIHGCIDGYSRKLLWLETASSNNCPKVIAGYYLRCVEKLKGTARVIRGDAGNENLNVAGIQRFFRNNQNDTMSGQKSFLFGKSTSNQRIEAFWSQLRRCFGQWWMNYFKDMKDSGSWNDTDPIQRECLKFCFTFVIKKELNEVMMLHNSHRIRPYPNQECPNGIPDILYDLPSNGSVNYKMNVTSPDIALARQYSRTVSPFGCSPEFERLALFFMIQNNLDFPRSADEGRQLYDDILTFINNVT